MRHAVWEHFEEIEPRTSSKTHPKAKCNYCNEQVRGQPKRFLIPHLLKKCLQAPPSVKQQLQGPQIQRSSLTPTTPASEEASDVELESEVAAEGLELVIQSPQPQGLRSQTQLQRLELMRLKTNVAKYRAKAMEAEFMAEKLAVWIKLKDLGVPDDEIERSLPSL
ncbi:uncharacterized protein PITG_08739 [Phytophthora infestans T30-4]|uniref:BED-type domain-containing protein n=2 Tax=Phytophthora infestans TaxID=4787 RepID=D0ND34_PHYIT|nr:uncharacterized protein PITG_08739 [Phytophthora infestans T30-4]EEY55991.1 conserved hypothetical protein [Phytophthora infestans T30-4]KAF4149554.1 BED zinc finger [Phytophthora infestans]KAI9981917.1 hypothetical protein PInf_009700 [Phytophthora infestans]|eukprot:XP_002902821.1 conserved hypothetical protein [Phytophthora infestans T30-4]